MFHPLIRTIASRPDLLVAHLGGYAELVGAQADDALAALRTRAVLLVGLAGGLLLGLGLAGTAGLLAAVVRLELMPAPWLLLAIPALPLALAAGCWLALRRQPPAWTADLLREQLAADAALLREAGAL